MGLRVCTFSNFLIGRPFDKWKGTLFCDNGGEIKWFWNLWRRRYIVNAVPVLLWYLGQFCFSLICSVVAEMHPSCPGLSGTLTTKRFTIRMIEKNKCLVQFDTYWVLFKFSISVCWGCIPPLHDPLSVQAAHVVNNQHHQPTQLNTVLTCTALQYTSMQCIVSQFSELSDELPCTVLQCTTLHCTVLHCTTLQ